MAFAETDRPSEAPDSHWIRSVRLVILKNLFRKKRGIEMHRRMQSISKTLSMAKHFLSLLQICRSVDARRV